eukprot:CAMPEP_0179175576 /NCGR_PEP_ID=MMETSP0796-20121207/86723_1 /TAXON_ID=73915 /ORGANISM="Pyrodinium bahamense, Strain pbaha01" /LENGTH=90 /DNA_ID=CAMNT_0020878935 /DNA_START=271 /DNA_END=539 /DNA_ORIENTATION=-
MSARWPHVLERLLPTSAHPSQEKQDLETCSQGLPLRPATARQCRNLRASSPGGGPASLWLDPAEDPGPVAACLDGGPRREAVSTPRWHRS